ncbi:hypothetical protein Aph02nite_45650 [Actinoplanes philippinensis]|uniref:Uncharacterized protein n=1 Tax=Actinoplanes philippinensis TaxID=35752 RepID=A0A1I2I6U5_9ACTN|nr:hypothetical protein [Actinoplanes philippinensis]GIE78615.1 hypothetical protein Aph02nite_45650 [Actinoplanes philippinensis]SFF37363.1 hypothetical protein SAMN05421541_109316 [Actinoplanes philippinensis]
MDRRKLIVGGGAAALAAVTAATILPAGASAAADTATTQHARRVLNLVDADLGAVDLDGATRLFKAGLTGYLASAPRDPDADDLLAWLKTRIKNLTGTDSIEAAVKQIPETRTLLAFAFLHYTQSQSRPQPKIARSMPVPAVLANLEPGFLPELLRQVQAKARTSPSFADALQISSDHVAQLIVADDAPGGPGPGHPTDEDLLNFLLVTTVVVIIIVTK